MNLDNHKDDVTFYNHWSDLKDYGIGPLTGEACGYGQRLLCDLTEDGQQLIRDFFSLPEGTTFSPNWNTTVNGKPSVGSIMLPRNLIDDLRVFIIFHIEKKKYAYVFPSDSIVGSDVRIEPEQLMEGCRCATNWALAGNHPNSGGRNVHAMSGRTV